MARTSTHKIETRGKNNFATVVNNFDALYRSVSERDYGIDGIVELFSSEGNVTGKIAFIQMKSTSKEILKNKRSDDISVSLSTSSLYYSKQSNVPFILIYNSLTEPDSFYYLLLNGAKFNAKQLTNTIKIPIDNKEKNSILKLSAVINNYYD